MGFIKYQHIERLGNDEVDGILVGDCYVFPKIDGTNGVLWQENASLKAGSRNRELALDNDNAGFFNSTACQMHFFDYLIEHPTHRLFGEWLVPHTLKTYRADAWRQFYVFDVAEVDEDTLRYLPYNEYSQLLDNFGILYITPMAVLTNPSEEKLLELLEKNTFLVQDGAGVGEGIVIKNYDFRNKYGRNTFAKIVRNEFKEKHGRNNPIPKSEIAHIEEDIAKKFVTGALVDKEYAKVVNEFEGWSSRNIPMFLGRVWNSIITEDMWDILKQFKNPKIDFKLLNQFVIKEVKDIKSDLF